MQAEHFGKVHFCPASVDCYVRTSIYQYAWLVPSGTGYDERALRGRWSDDGFAVLLQMVLWPKLITFLSDGRKAVWSSWCTMLCSYWVLLSTDATLQHTSCRWAAQFVQLWEQVMLSCTNEKVWGNMFWGCLKRWKLGPTEAQSSAAFSAICIIETARVQKNDLAACFEFLCWSRWCTNCWQVDSVRINLILGIQVLVIQLLWRRVI